MYSKSGLVKGITYKEDKQMIYQSNLSVNSAQNRSQLLHHSIIQQGFVHIEFFFLLKLKACETYHELHENNLNMCLCWSIGKQLFAGFP